MVDGGPPSSANADDSRSERRQEDRRFLCGAGHYTDDKVPVGAVYAVFVRSPHAHAAIRSIDTATGSAMPGVLGVFTAQDLLADGVRPLPCGMNPEVLGGVVVPPRHALALGRVRYVGEAVAVVVAETRFTAQDAAERVVADYDDLRSITALDAALAEGAPQLWPEAPGNLAYRFRRGDPAAVAAVFASAAHAVELDLVNNRVVAASLETRAALAGFDAETARFHLLLSGQGVHGIRNDLATCLGVPPEMVHVACPDVGGGFGMKNVVHPEYVALLWAARRLRRPVRWTAERTEDFLSGVHGRDNLTTARLALDEGGRFLALDVQTIGNLGTYVSSLGPGASTIAPSTAMGGVYAIPAVAMDVRGAFTNTVPVDAYRGAGKPEANYVIERLIDVAAHQLGYDRVALRRANLIDTFPYRAALGTHMDIGNFRANLDAAAEAADQAGFARRRAEAASRGRLLGQGIACFLETSRGPLPPRRHGRIAVRHAVQRPRARDKLRAVRRQAARPALRTVPPGAGGYGPDRDGRRARRRPLSAHGRRGARDGARFCARTGACRGRPAITGRQSKHLLRRRRVPCRGRRHHHLIRPGRHGALDADAHNPNDLFVFPSGCHVAEVEVDPETGAVVLQRYVAIDDYGVLVNPLLTEGQVQGGLAQGIGQALLEQVRYDREHGQLLTATFSDYTLPRAADLPWLNVKFDETAPSARNPLGAKGAGQAGAIGAPQAVMGAVADALGVAHVDMPATPEAIWRACRARARLPPGSP